MKQMIAILLLAALLCAAAVPGLALTLPEDPADILVRSAEGGEVVYYRRAGYDLPAFPTADEISGFAESMTGAERRAMVERFVLTADGGYGWAADQVFADLCPDADQLFTSLFLLRFDENTGFYALCNDGQVRAVAVIRLPETGEGEPELLAYVDVMRDPQVGYDGCITKGEAIEIAYQTCREKFGDDAADHMEVDFVDFLACELDNYGYDQEIGFLEEAGGPYWAVDLKDPRGDEDGPDYIEGFESAWEFWIGIDAKTGEIYDMTEELQPFGRG